MSKITGSHSTYIEQAESLLKFLDRNHLVTKIALSIITAKRPPSKTEGRTKIQILADNGCILLNLGSKLYNQEIRVYGKDLQKIAEEIAKFMRNEGREIGFGKHIKMK